MSIPSLVGRRVLTTRPGCFAIDNSSHSTDRIRRQNALSRELQHLPLDIIATVRFAKAARRSVASPGDGRAGARPYRHFLPSYTNLVQMIQQIGGFLIYSVNPGPAHFLPPPSPPN